MTLNQDAHFMALAIKLAEKGVFTTDPNPRVGCVIVQNNKLIAEGWHVKAGSAHAEIEALKKLDNADGATAYVTLEPCSHTGRTGPCCEALVKAGVKRVVVAMQDPNPLVSGQGIQKMQKAGLTVDCGVLQQDAEVLNKGFIKRMTVGLPYVRSKMAMSLDGRTAMASGESQWITSTESRLNVQKLRAESSAILTGINTVLADDPSLNARLDEEVVQPVRVVLDTQLKIPVKARMIGLKGETWVLTGSTDTQKISQLEDLGVKVFRFNTETQSTRIDLKQVMIFLGQQQINTVLVEAGAILNGYLLEENCVDEWVVYMASCVLGDQGRGLFHLPALQKMVDKKQFNLEKVRQVGPDLKLTFTMQ